MHASKCIIPVKEVVSHRVTSRNIKPEYVVNFQLYNIL